MRGSNTSIKNTSTKMPQLKAPNLLDYPHYWAECYGTAPFLPMSRTEMDDLGWDSCDIILICGDAYVDHPSFGMAIIGRLLESQGYRVGLICQPDWRNKSSFEVLGRPNLFFAVSAGNMDSMINRYTADKRIRHDDAYTPAGAGGKRPDEERLLFIHKSVVKLMPMSLSLLVVSKLLCGASLSMIIGPMKFVALY